jgi:RNA polymerase sigma factor (sigma-70 family)
MANSRLDHIALQLRRAALGAEGAGLTDGQLLETFLERRDEAAFEALVRRHGPMVLGVCRRVLGNVHDAEDAFQATFFVLVRKAGVIRQRELLGNWLYGVAYRTALEARGKSARQRSREKQVETMPQPVFEPNPDGPELAGLLDQELSRLPDKYRVPIVLCDLECRSRHEVAQHLGVPEGTLSSRLAAGRNLLAQRLTRRGMALTGAALGVVLSQNAALAGVPSALVLATVKAGALMAAGEAVAAGVLAPQGMALMNGVMHTMFLAKLKLAVIGLAAVAVVSVGAGLVGYRMLAQGPAAPSSFTQGSAKAPEATPEELPPPLLLDKSQVESPIETPPEKGKTPLADRVTLTGTVSKKVEERKGDGGGTRTVTSYFLTEPNGNVVQLPPPRKNDAGDPLGGINLDDFVGKEVVVSGSAQTARQSEREDLPRKVTKLLATTEIKLKN